MSPRTDVRDLGREVVLPCVYQQIVKSGDNAADKREKNAPPGYHDSEDERRAVHELKCRVVGGSSAAERGEKPSERARYLLNLSGKVTELLPLIAWKQHTEAPKLIKG